MCNIINQLHNEVSDCKGHVDLRVDGRVCVVQKFPAFYGTLKITTIVTRVGHSTQV